MRKRYYHDELGRNSRLDEIQAAVLLAKLPFLHGWNRQRHQVAAWYKEELQHCPGLTLPTVTPGNTHVYHQYTIRVQSGSTRNADDASLGSFWLRSFPRHQQHVLLPGTVARAEKRLLATDTKKAISVFFRRNWRRK